MQRTLLALAILLFSSITYAQNLMPYVYLTYEEEDTSTSITINFMTDDFSENSYAYYGQVSEDGNPDLYEFKIPSRTGTIDDINRSYHHVKLNHLQPNTTYYFVVGDPEIGYSREYKFRTLPSDDTPLKIVAGGDMSTNDRVWQVPQFAMTQEPHVIFIGGDISYANGKTKNIDRWDLWFQHMMKVMETPNGFLVPLIVAIGNHEVTTGIVFPWSKAPFYEELFAQNNGRTYFTRKLGGNAVLLVLDTGHMETFSSQKDFIKNELRKYRNLKHRLALYHAPIYPNHRSENDQFAARGKTNWLKYFDRYHLTVAFENHDHTLKRTKVLKNDAVAEKGTIYVGDGCWGKEGRSSNPQKWYLEKAESEAHVWSVEIHPEHLNFMATAGKEGNVFDHFKLTNTDVKTIVEEE